MRQGPLECIYLAPWALRLAIPVEQYLQVGDSTVAGRTAAGRTWAGKLEADTHPAPDMLQEGRREVVDCTPVGTLVLRRDHHVAREQRRRREPGGRTQPLQHSANAGGEKP